DLDGDDLMACGELEQRPAPVARTAKVRDDDDDRALPGRGARVDECVRQRRRASTGPFVRSVQRRQQADEADPPLPWAHDLEWALAECDQAEPVPTACRDVADRQRD